MSSDWMKVTVPIAFWSTVMLQLLAVLDGIVELTGLPVLLAAWLLVLVGPIPVVSTLLAFYGAVEAWGWGPGWAMLFFLWPWVIAGGLIGSAALMNRSETPDGRRCLLQNGRHGQEEVCAARPTQEPPPVVSAAGVESASLNASVTGVYRRSVGLAGLALCSAILVVGYFFWASTSETAGDVVLTDLPDHTAPAHTLASREARSAAASAMVAETRLGLSSDREREAYDRLMAGIAKLDQDTKAFAGGNSSSGEKRVEDILRSVSEAVILLEREQQALGDNGRLTLEVHKRYILATTPLAVAYVRAASGTVGALESFAASPRELLDAELFLLWADTLVGAAEARHVFALATPAFHRQAAREVGLPPDHAEEMVRVMEVTGELRQVVEGSRLQAEAARLLQERFNLLASARESWKRDEEARKMVFSNRELLDEYERILDAERAVERKSEELHGQAISLEGF